MSRRSNRMIKAALSALYYSGADGLAAPYTRGEGVIFMLHRVTPEPVEAFEPNRILKVTPEFLEEVVRQVIEAGFDLLHMDELPQRLADGKRSRRFACFTLDDGYRDNLEYALPVFKRYGVPFTVYIPTDYADGRGDLWWLMLERVISSSQCVGVRIAGTERAFDTRSVKEKEFAYDEIYWWLRSLPEEETRRIVASLAEQCGLSAEELCREMIMSWEEVRSLAADPLVTIGAHTCRHLALARLGEAEARHEMQASIDRIERELGLPCRHFSYPYGCELSAGEREFELSSELGVVSAVTTRKGHIEAAHADKLMALPRFSLNGDFQDARYVKVMLSGMPFRLWNAVGRVASARAAT